MSGGQEEDTIQGFGLSSNVADSFDSPNRVVVDLDADSAQDGFGAIDTLVNLVRVRS